MQDSAIARNTRRRVSKNRMVIQNVSKLDIAVYQCNISNRHGYLLGNFFLNVNCKCHSFLFFLYYDQCSSLIAHLISGKAGNSNESGLGYSSRRGTKSHLTLWSYRLTKTKDHLDTE